MIKNWKKITWCTLAVMFFVTASIAISSYVSPWIFTYRMVSKVQNKQWDSLSQDVDVVALKKSIKLKFMKELVKKMNLENEDQFLSIDIALTQTTEMLWQDLSLKKSLMTPKKVINFDGFYKNMGRFIIYMETENGGVWVFELKRLSPWRWNLVGLDWNAEALKAN